MGGGSAGEGPCPWQTWGHSVALLWWVIVFPADSTSWLHGFSAGVADCSPFPGSVLRLSLGRCLGLFSATVLRDLVSRVRPFVAALSSLVGFGGSWGWG